MSECEMGTSESEMKDIPAMRALISSTDIQGKDSLSGERSTAALFRASSNTCADLFLLRLMPAAKSLMHRVVCKVANSKYKNMDQGCFPDPSSMSPSLVAILVVRGTGSSLTAWRRDARAFQSSPWSVCSTSCRRLSEHLDRIQSGQLGKEDSAAAAGTDLATLQ